MLLCTFRVNCGSEEQRRSVIPSVFPTCRTSHPPSNTAAATICMVDGLFLWSAGPPSSPHPACRSDWPWPQWGWLASIISYCWSSRSLLPWLKVQQLRDCFSACCLPEPSDQAVRVHACTRVIDHLLTLVLVRERWWPRPIHKAQCQGRTVCQKIDCDG